MVSKVERNLNSSVSTLFKNRDVNTMGKAESIESGFALEGRAGSEV